MLSASTLTMCLHLHQHVDKCTQIEKMVKINLGNERNEGQGAQRGCEVSLESEITELLRTSCPCFAAGPLPLPGQMLVLRSQSQ